MEFGIGTVYDLTKEIEREEQRLANLRDAVQRITRSYCDEPRGSSYKSQVEELTTLIVDAENRLRDLLDSRLVAQVQTLSVIRRAGLEPAEERILELRYCQCLPFDSIAAEMSYSRPHIFRLHKAARAKLLTQFDEIISAFEMQRKDC